MSPTATSMAGLISGCNVTTRPVFYLSILPSTKRWMVLYHQLSARRVGYMPFQSCHWLVPLSVTSQRNVSMLRSWFTALFSKAGSRKTHLKRYGPSEEWLLSIDPPFHFISTSSLFSRLADTVHAPLLFLKIL